MENKEFDDTSLWQKFTLPLTRDYVKSWTVLEAVREILQNAIDYGQGKLAATFVPEDGETFCLRVFSAGAKLEPKTLLLGCTSKAEDKEAIGSFGEGYKIALLVLAREGYDVELKNTCLSWFPQFEYSDKFEAEVLCILQRPNHKDPQLGVEFVIKGITAETKNKIIENTLQLQADVGKFHRVSQGDILLDRKGKLYVNGLFVSETGLEYGYNVKPEFLTLERDRQTVSHFDLKFLTKDMWFETRLYTEVADLLEKDTPDLEYGQYGCPELIKEACYKLFVSKHPQSVIASSQAELERIVASGVTNTVVVYSDSYASVVKSSCDYRENVKTVEVLSPTAQLKLFLKANKQYMRRPAIADLKDLIEDSKKWKA